MSRSWTEQQKAAIESRDGSILVSAAAGSGKTAVLVERVIERITDISKPCPADSLLIVTFTKAAAGEMKERIYSALKEEIRQDPNNAYLRQQEMLLPNADICTMDSFSYSLVKENFRLTDVSPDLKVIDKSELSLLEAAAIDTVMENEYQKGDRAFTDLVELLFKSRDDTQIAECVTKLYTYSRAYAFPDEWLDSILDGFDPSIGIAENCWGKAIIDYAIRAVDYCIELNKEMFVLMAGKEDIGDVFINACTGDKNYLESLRETLSNGKWDEARLMLGTRFKPRKKLSDELKEDRTVKLICDKRDKIKNIISKKLPEYMCVSEEENAEDAEIFAPMIKKLIECVREFGEELMKLKKEKNSYDFPDISHMALNLLIKKENGEIVKTPLAEELSSRYTEILIDEYQDTNEAQHIFFDSISNNSSNLFRVGDVKQSIYSFRQAMPEIFTGLRDSLDSYENGNYPAKITLDKNFRSRKSVTGFVNFVFSQIMSKDVGGVDYDKNEELVAGATYPAAYEMPIRFHMINMSSEYNCDLDPQVVQARHVASLIKNMIANEEPIGREGEQRPIRYKDICILMRSVKSGAATTYANELRNWGIPCFTEVTGSFFSSSEISVMLSILRITDNPNQDIPLLSALMSPIFAFTPDETAKLRISDRRSSLYACLLKAESENSKVASFLKFFRRMRFIASTCTASELIRRILDETSYLAIVQAMSDGELRRSNLMLLVDYAEAYESSGMTGLSGFIRFIDKLFINKKELNASNPISENADVVKIMTIHKSKGLEFPVCILANTEKKFNTEDEKKRMIISPSCGVGLLMRDQRTMAEYETLSHMSAKLQMNLSMKSEEMRVLYVALTRAKEELIIVSSADDAEKVIEKAAIDIDALEDKFFPFSILSNSSYRDWLLKAVLRHPDMLGLRNSMGIDNMFSMQWNFDSIVEFKVIDRVRSYQKAVTDVSENAEIDKDLQRLIDERVNFKYKYAPLASVATKRAASQIDEKLINRENFAVSRPEFMTDGKLTAAQRGTATHKFMQFADFASAEKDVSSEAERLASSGKLTKEEADNIRKDEIEAFFRSELYKRIRSSNNVMREKQFTVNVPAERIYPELKGELNEDIMVQGMTDCAFEENGKLVVVDYKTDRIDSEDIFRNKYTKQLKLYKYALEQITGMEVAQACLYSFKMSKTIEIF